MKIDQYHANSNRSDNRKSSARTWRQGLECEARLWLGNTYQRIGEYQTAIENHEQKIH